MKRYFHPHYVHLVFVHIKIVLWTFVNYLLALYWRIDLDDKCRFNGKTFFRLLPGSSIHVGKGCQFNSSKNSNLIGVYGPCMISALKIGSKIQIGDKCGFSGTVIAAALSIKLGNNVRCGANTLITDTDWHTDDYRTGPDKEIIIEDNVWLGYGVKVLKGVHIGENSLIGANSVVTKDIPANVIAAGNPCKVIKSIKGI